MSELLRFGHGFLRHWAGYITGSALVGVLAIEEHVKGRPVPGWLYLLIGCGGVVFSAFRTWREEASRADALEKQLAACRAEAEDVVIPDISNELYWLLAIAKGCRMRRERVAGVPGTPFAIWIGETPISFEPSQRFYEIAKTAEAEGFLKQETIPGGTTVYRLPRESEEIVEVERRRKRTLLDPSFPLHDARTGKVVQIPRPF